MRRVIGYYICEQIKIPQFLKRDGTMVSVSECFGGIHPRLDTCFFQNSYVSEKDRDAYKKRWNLDAEKAESLIKETGTLFDRTLSADGRFVSLSDARHFYDSFFSKNCILVSVSAEEKYFEFLKDEMRGNGCLELTGCTDEHDLLGYDILGWDTGSFHTFLCNSLQEMLPGVVFNSYGLLANSYDEVSVFAERIQGYGEPVEWIPCRVGKCSSV